MQFLQCRGVAKIYPSKAGPVEALRGIDLTASEGEFLCLLGLSGCGKSTLLQLTAGLEAPTAGSIRNLPIFFCSAGDGLWPMAVPRPSGVSQVRLLGCCGHVKRASARRRRPSPAGGAGCAQYRSGGRGGGGRPGGVP
jgi:energy-coupling factor transporter ATP-binding protein EcfA2